jgi:large subunit ribosomal protein L24
MGIQIKSGDKVVVISGADKSADPKPVLEVIEADDRVVVEGVNLRWKHEKPSQINPKGGRTRREFPIHISNVLIFSEKAGKGVRTRVEVQDGKKVRVGIPCGTVFE